MKADAAARWILSVCCSLRRSQAKTLSDLALAALQLTRATIGELGRSLSLRTDVAAKHAIKRVDRFLGNSRIEPVSAMGDVIRWLSRPNKRLLVSLDWVDIRNLHVLVLAARLEGRAIPLLWAAYREESLFRSQNNLEYGLLRALRAFVGDFTQVVVLADRGFGRAEMARECQALGLGYIIRIKPDVYIRHKCFTGKLLDLPVRRGYRKVFRGVSYRKKGPVEQHVAVIWAKERKEPWFLMTSLERTPAAKLAKIYGHRMTIEECFRDHKSKRNGFGLRLNLIREPKRLERMFLVLAFAYILLVAVGLEASRKHPSGRWCSNNRKRECSLFTIGRAMLAEINPGRPSHLQRLRSAVLTGNWG